MDDNKFFEELGLDPNDPELQAIQAKIREHTEYHKEHPEQCPHNGIVAPVVRGEGEQPGQCLDCGAYPVMERKTDCPLCAEEDRS